ncbi:MAG TPA: hypothetical protein DER01_09280, partial [Phycisphaerales bacterium]|nr:hypothetical protein [Phycisphaerales bacterium]
KVKAPNLKPLHAKALELLAQFDHWSFDHVLRHLNKRADELANRAMDARKTVAGDATKTPVLSAAQSAKTKTADDLFSDPSNKSGLSIKVLEPAACCRDYAKSLSADDAGKQRCPQCGALLMISF